MHKSILAALAAAALFAAPAFAQPSTSHNSSSTTNGNASATTPQNLQQVRQKITSDLRSDGYTDIHVIPDSFLVHAKNKQGEPVVMIINPDSVFAVTQVPGQANASSPNGSGSHNSGLGNSSNSNNSTNPPTKQ